MISVIIVDDEVLSRIGIQSFLKGKKEISVEGVFGRAKDAIEFLDKKTVDIVITDIEMADMNGLEFIKIIRAKNLADGVIILSCHDNFDYAREAIALGTDQYMLKHDIDEPKLLQVINAVYKKITANRSSAVTTRKLDSIDKHVEENGIYELGIIKLLDPSSGEIIEKGQVEESMLVHLLEEITSRYNMGTLFAPYKREIFIIFRFDLNIGEIERKKTMKKYVNELQNNLKQYINKWVVIGISSVFCDLQEIPKRYDEAAAACEMSFYQHDVGVFYSEDKVQSGAQNIQPSLALERLLEQNGAELFEKELSRFLEECKNKNMSIEYLKETLSHCMSGIFYKMTTEYNFTENLAKQWKDYQIIAVITSAENVEPLKNKLVEIMSEFIKKLHEEIRNDGFGEIFQYINNNLTQKISLVDMANMKCMSVPSFCKKFKERTSLTLVQYVNQCKIERSKTYLKNQSYSLGEIADLAGFSNENYMVRVFKKVTGQTITDYRNCI